MPGVQTLVPLLLDHHAAGRLSLQRLVDLTSAGAHRLYGSAGKGRIAGGVIKACDMVRAKTVGSPGEPFTAILLGIDPDSQDAIDRVEQKLSVQRPQACRRSSR